MVNENKNPIEQERELLADLLDRVAERIELEASTRSDFVAQTETAESEFEIANQSLDEVFRRELAEIQHRYESRTNEIGSAYVKVHGATQSEFDELLFRIRTEYESDCQQIQDQYEEAQWMVNSIFDESSETSPKQQFEVFESNVAKFREQITERSNELGEYQQKAIDLLQLRRQSVDATMPNPSRTPIDQEDAAVMYSDSFEAARKYFDRLQAQKVVRLFVNRRPYLALFIGWLVLTSVLVASIPPELVRLNMLWTDPPWLGIVAAVAFAISLGSLGLLFAFCKTRSEKCYWAFLQEIANTKQSRRHWQQFSKLELERRGKEFKRWYAAITEERDSALTKGQANLTQKLAEFEQRKETALRNANQKYPSQLTAITNRRDRETRENDAERDGGQHALERRHKADSQRLRDEHEQFMAEFVVRRNESWNSLFENWKSAINQFAIGSGTLCHEFAEKFPDWERLEPQTLSLPDNVPSGIPIGEFDVDLENIEGGIAKDTRLVPNPANFKMPVILPFPESPSLLIQSSGAGRAKAIETMQTTMLRMLTSLPGGKLRFLVIDPVGLGENFAGFMHLADYDELMITNRIWTESSQIEKRLVDLTEHMENVFQKYLRNEFQSIQEYNEHAGEVAEPYHILVVANFPTNFTEHSARRLMSIATSGARCGVYTLISVDTQQNLPRNFQMADLEQAATCLQWGDDERFYVDDPDFNWLPLTLDPPPVAGPFSELVKAAGRESKDARRVEVPFGRIAPKADKLWSLSSQKGLDFPLGRAGATKLQHMRLGKGTSQHVLVAGKTGSGKSTFLHALIVNIALHYSPNEVEFYLIDFKKGVEFKTYATHKLPHARVIAIESDREFGVSVLQRLDGILKERGDLFRQYGVQDLPSYREAVPGAHLPRILLIIDEFQEFFVEDDKNSQQAALLLDRLVRQGRAFGMHVLLGSQTLGGAYSLARSTLGQMAVRVALQCSESDAHLILSEDNTAARLLTRPGEAIYNDANGMMEGNNPFQIAWLPDEDRERRLQQIQELVVRDELQVTPAIVFEGNIPAAASNNQLLLSALEPVVWPKRTAVLPAWLGEAVAIKGHTEAVFRPQSGMNLLIAGQNSRGALGIMSACVVSAAAQVAPAQAPDAPALAQFYVLDGTRPDEPEAGQWQRVFGAFPQSTKRTEPNQTTEVISELIAEVERRGADTSGTPIFVLVYNLGRFRDLRKSDDDYSFGSDKDKPTSVNKQFSDLLRNGPAVGIHTIIWCDTYNNVNRWLSREAIREMEMRVVFQMSSADSSNLIDTPAAAKLGNNRALVYLEEHGTTEKFRPYGPASDAWLETVKSHLAKRQSFEVCDDLSMWSIS